jgi:hypothetical protein
MIILLSSCYFTYLLSQKFAFFGIFGAIFGDFFRSLELAVIWSKFLNTN